MRVRLRFLAIFCIVATLFTLFTLLNNSNQPKMTSLEASLKKQRVEGEVKGADSSLKSWVKYDEQSQVHAKNWHLLTPNVPVPDSKPAVWCLLDARTQCACRRGHWRSGLRRSGCISTLTEADLLERSWISQRLRKQACSKMLGTCTMARASPSLR